MDNARDQERDREENCCPFIGSVEVVAIVNFGVVISNSMDNFELHGPRTICSVRHNYDISRMIGSFLSSVGGVRSHSNRAQVALTILAYRLSTSSLSIGGWHVLYITGNPRWPRRTGPHHQLSKTT